MSETTESIMQTLRDERFEHEVSKLAESKIQETLQRHGIDRSQLKDVAVQEAHQWAREKLTAEKEQQSNPFYLENQRLKEQLRQAEMQTQAMRDARQPVSSPGEDPNVTIDRARARVGIAAWNHQFTEKERLAAVGIDFATVTPALKAEIADVFGPKSSSTRAADLRKSDPAKYNRLKLIGRTLRII